MEHIIRIREKVFFLMIFYVYILVIGFYLMNERTYAYSESVQRLRNQYFMYIYAGIWIYYVGRGIQEVLIYHRMKDTCMEKMYSSSSKEIIVKIVLVVISQILFWIGFMTNYDLLSFFSITMGVILIPNIMKASIFQTKQYLICSGVKYYFQDIDEVTESFLYKIELQVKGKSSTIYCGNAKKQKLVSGILANSCWRKR